jgi:hypothetical protein
MHNQIPQLVASQSDKVTTINLAVEQLDDALSETTSVTVSGSFILTDEQQNNCVRFLLTGTPGAAFTMALQARKKLFVVTNDTGDTCTVEVDPDNDGADGTTVDVEDGETLLLYSDGANVVAASSAGGGGSLVIQDDASTIVAAASTINFTGAGVSVTDSGSGVAQVAIAGGGSGGGASANLLTGRMTNSSNQTSLTGFVSLDWDTISNDTIGALDTSAKTLEVTAEMVGKPLLITGTLEGTNNTSTFAGLYLQKSTDGGSTYNAVSRDASDNVSDGCLQLTYLEPSPVLGHLYQLFVFLDASQDVKGGPSTAFSYVVLAAEVLSGEMEVNAQSGTSYTPTLTDANDYIVVTNSSPITLTIPPDSSVAYDVGTTLTIEQGGTGTITVSPGSGVTINSRGSLLSLNGLYAVATCVKTATDTWTLTGDLA